jgi:PAS domain S-box-containing protein
MLLPGFFFAHAIPAKDLIDVGQSPSLNDATVPGSPPSLIVGDGQMADLTRRLDWSSTSLGPIEGWPAALISSVNMILSAPLPMQIFWGPEMIVFYNDALAPAFAEKHPSAMGGPGREVWKDAWPFVGSQLEDVFERGMTHYVKNVVIPLIRGGELTDTSWDYSYSPLFAGDGSVAGVLDVAQDRTEEARTERAKRESDERLNLAMESADLGMWSYDPATGIVAADERMHRIFGSPQGAGSINYWLDLLHPDDSERVGKHFQESLEGKHPYELEYRIIRPDGVRWLRSKGRITWDGRSTKRMFAIIEDITARKSAEEALRTSEALLQESQEDTTRSEAQLKLITDALPAYIAYVDRDYRYQRVNRTYEDWFDLPADRMMGRTIDEVLGAETATQVRRRMDLALQGIPQHFEYSPIIKGQERVLSVSHVPDLDENGDARGVVIQGHDITEQKRIQQALIQSEKLAAVGKLASSIAHEINNPLESVTNLLYLARNPQTNEQERDEFLATAERELRRVSVITSQTLRFHKQSSNPSPVMASDLIDGVVSIYQGRLVNSNITVSRRERALRPIVCFEGEIRQVMNNLTGNAIDAMPTAGRLLLRSREATDWKTGKNGIVVTIADTGAGMSEAVSRKIFDPFFTTKGIGGTGLGLWISKEIVTRHHGELRVRSSQRPGRSGTVFTMFLPFDAVKRV